MVTGANPTTRPIGPALSNVASRGDPAPSPATAGKGGIPTAAEVPANSETGGSAAMVGGLGNMLEQFSGAVKGFLNQQFNLAAPFYGKSATPATGNSQESPNKIENKTTDAQNLKKEALAELQKINPDIKLDDISTGMAKKLASGDLEPRDAVDRILKQKEPAKKPAVEATAAAPVAPAATPVAPPEGAPQSRSPKPQ